MRETSEIILPFVHHQNAYIKISNTIELITVSSDDDQKNQTMIDFLRISHGNVDNAVDNAVDDDDDDDVMENSCLALM